MSRQKIKRVEIRFIEKQLEIARRDLEQIKAGNANRDNPYITSYTDGYFDGIYTGKQREIETLEHLLENCAE